ncbi:MAG: ATP-binding protein, partial [Draconibacterium sp.]|nr:ATP-binding protein [Draconibacterium sp.]
LKYQALHTQYQDTLFQQTLNREITDIQEKYNTAQRLSEISSQKDLLLQNELKLKNRNLLNYLLLFGLVLLGVIIFGLFKRYKHKRREYQQELILKESQTFNKLQEQRLQISRDLHDNIGSQLTFIISSINNLSFLTKSSNEKLRSKLNEINSFAMDTIAQFRDTIWAMNSDVIQLEDFQGRVLSYIEKAKSSTTGILFVFDANVSTPLIFSATEGINLFRVIQEAINNAIKHGNPSQISIVLKTTGQKFQVIITDDGSGFDINGVSTGNGLENMKKRMEAIGGKIMITSKGDRGTEIILNLRK